jgi:hypothetical protein
LLYHVVMLNLFQHLLFQRIPFKFILPEIPKQVRNDKESSPVVISNETPLSLRAPTCWGAAISAWQSQEVQETSCRGSGGAPQL